MTDPNTLKVIFDRIAAGVHTEADLATLRRVMTVVSGDNNVIQLGKYNVSIGQGRDIQVGDNIYQGASAEAIQEALRQVLAEVSIRQALAGSSFTQQAHRIRYKLLREVKSKLKIWIDDSLPNKVRINILKKDEPQLVERVGYRGVKRYSRSSSLLSPEIKIIDVFDRGDIGGKLLILGNPGSGKTVELLELLQELIERSEADYNEPIPVLLNLSSWKNQTIEEWLARELQTSDYGISIRTAWKLIKGNQILPLLDGLDELDSQLQSRCVSAINRFLSSNYRPIHLVVSCRFIEYKRSFPKLKLNGAICLQPLTEEQIQQYLASLAPSKLFKDIQNDSNLFELARTPLFLFIITQCYDNLSLHTWKTLRYQQERYSYLFNVYIEQMLDIPLGRLRRGFLGRFFKTYPNHKKTKRWLSFIAKRLKENAEADLLIERIQPAWLQTKKEKRIFRLSVGILSGLTSSLSIFPIIIIKPGFFLIMPHLFFNFFGLFVNGIASAFKNKIEPVESLKLPWTALQDSWKSKRIFYWISYPLLALLISYSSGLLIPFLGGMIIASFVFWLINQAGENIKTPEIALDKRAFPNQGIWRSALYTFILSLSFGLIGAIIGRVVFSQSMRNTFGYPFPVIFFYLDPLYSQVMDLVAQEWGMDFTTLFAVIWFWSFGAVGGGLLAGTACVQHFTLRLVLWWHGYIPWNYNRFLNYATKRMFMQRIGGRYRFIHHLLLEHFAQIPYE